MSQSARPVSEEDLHAYVDDQLDSERRVTVELYLREHSAAAEQVAADMAQRAALRAAFSEFAAQPVPPSLNLTRLVEARLQRRYAPRRVAAMLLLTLGLGVGGGWWAGSRPATGIAALAQEAAINYAVYAVDQRRPVEIWDEHREELTRWLSRRLDHKLMLPDLTAAGYQFLGGRLVASSHGPAALLVYQDAAGRRLVIYVRPMAAGPETTPIRQIDVKKLDGCAWIERGVGYSVIAADSYPELLEVSRRVRQDVAHHG